MRSMTARVCGMEIPEPARIRAQSQLSSVVACQVMSQHWWVIGQTSVSVMKRRRSSSLRLGSWSPNWTYSRSVMRPGPRMSLRYSETRTRGLRPLLRLAWRRYSAVVPFFRRSKARSSRTRRVLRRLGHVRSSMDGRVACQRPSFSGLGHEQDCRSTRCVASRSSGRRFGARSRWPTAWLSGIRRRACVHESPLYRWPVGTGAAICGRAAL